jgi:MFS family permease
MPSKRFQIIAIFITIFIDLIGFGILIPVLPTYAKNFLGANEFHIGLILASYSFMQFLFNPIIGQLSDKFGRKLFIVSCLYLLGITYFLLPFAKNVWLFLIIRAIAGIGGANIGVSQAYIADITTKEERTKAMGIIGVAFGFGFMIGPVIGGIISHYLGFFYIGVFSGLLSTTAATFALIVIPKTKTSFKQITIKHFKLIDYGNFTKILNLPEVGLLILLFFIVTFSIANIFGTLPLLGIQIYKLNDLHIGIVMSSMGLAGILTQAFLTHNLENKLGYYKLLLLSMIILALGLALMPLGNNVFYLIFFVIIFAVGQGLLQNLLPSLISKKSPHNLQGAILGVNQSLSAFARALGPLWGGFSFHYIGYKTPYLTGSIFALLTFFIARNNLKRKYDTNK